jgi:predicted site-specific integrase-resolvase
MHLCLRDHSLEPRYWPTSLCDLCVSLSSRQEQADNLERQADRLRQAANTGGYLLVETIAKQASSLNEKRRGMKKLFSLIEKEAVDVMLIEYPDRLVRFGFPYLLQAFAWRGRQAVKALLMERHRE